jgi:hypothetical protein
MIPRGRAQSFKIARQDIKQQDIKQQDIKRQDINRKAAAEPVG